MTAALLKILCNRIINYSEILSGGSIQCRSRATCWSTHACPLASASKAARVRRPHYSRVNIRAYASAIRVTRVCARVTSERVSIASIPPRPLPPRKKVEGLGTRLACPLRVNSCTLARSSVSACVFEYSRVLARVPASVRFRVLACTRASTRVCVCKYSRVLLARVHACTTRTSTRVCMFEYSRATRREGCQFARERHCSRIHREVSSFSRSS